MNKRTIENVPTTALSSPREWLNVEDLAEVEITSEHPSHPIESALIAGQDSGRLAAEPGRQTIRMIFTNPQPLRQIWLNFHEPDVERTQEYVLRWSPERPDDWSLFVCAIREANTETMLAVIDLPELPPEESIRMKMSGCLSLTALTCG